MKRSRSFWAGIVLLAIVPVLLIDIAVHSINWKKEVREEMIGVAHNNYELTREDKAIILDRILDRNQKLNALIYLKSFACCVLFVAAIVLLIRSRREKRTNLLASVSLALAVMAFFMGVKMLLAGVLTNNRIRLLPAQAETLSLRELYDRYYKNKVLYVDFWGTTCGPCLKEFRDHTHPLKKRYAGQANMAYLYISQGNRYLWKQQLQKYDVEGDHLFLDNDAYDKLYREAAGNDSVPISMPRYIIMGRDGRIAEPDAKRPSEKDSLYFQIEKYLLSIALPF